MSLDDSKESHSSDDGPLSWKNLSGEDWEKAIADTVAWHHISGAPDYFPHYKLRARAIIKTRLGYAPTENVIASYDNFLRVVAHANDHGHLSLDQYAKTAEAIVTAIRNKDMLLYDEFEISQNQYEAYEATKDSFSGIFVKNRIRNMLGQNLPLHLTLPAELMLQFMVNEGIHFDDTPNEHDMKALTIIGYRQTLLESGKEAANSSPLWYFDFAQSNGYFNEDQSCAKIPNCTMHQ